jgi:hypothetical protein
MSGVDNKWPERGDSSPGVVRIFGQMLLMPFTVFVYSMELLMRTMRGVQQTVDQGMEVLVGESVAPDLSASESRHDETAISEDAPTPGVAGSEWSDLKSETESTAVGGAIEGATDPIHKEIHKMRDKDLSDDQLKLVRYKILFVKRDYEVAFQEREELVHDNITGEAFTAWKIAEFIQRLTKEPIPDKWRKKKYPKRHDDEIVPDDRFIHRLDEDDKKYLRVYYEVLERYVREEDDTEVDVLKDIHKAIERLPRIDASSRTASATTTTSAPVSGGGGGGSTADTSGSAGGGRGLGD